MAPSATLAVCETPVTEEICTAIEANQAGTDAEFSPAACPLDELVGTCDKGPTQLAYYEGPPDQLEIGCAMQGGTWINPSG
ncbi:MAG: hypothetical protein HC937_03940 [Aquincola sp.]|nr:hypothetical protein [Aquincola sp.]